MTRKPISLRMDPQEWQSFVALCQNEGTTATEQISIFIRQCLAQGLPLCDEDLDISAANQAQQPHQRVGGKNWVGAG